MLVLTRRIGEVVVLNPGTAAEVRIKLVDIDRNKIRLGIDAPDDVMILRGELVGRDDRKSPPDPAA